MDDWSKCTKHNFDNTVDESPRMLDGSFYVIARSMIECRRAILCNSYLFSNTIDEFGWSLCGQTVLDLVQGEFIIGVISSFTYCKQLNSDASLTQHVPIIYTT